MGGNIGCGHGTSGANGVNLGLGIEVEWVKLGEEEVAVGLGSDVFGVGEEQCF